jgi:PKHD-type hydroxylase
MSSLYQLPDLLLEQELHDARQLLVDAPWQDGRGSAGGQAAQVKNNEQLPRSCAAAQAIQACVLQALDRSTLFFSMALPRRVFPPHVNRYGAQRNHYGAHVDNAVRLSGEQGRALRTDLSATVFLNDPDEYDGGELCIGTGLAQQRIKLPAGHMVLYAGNSLHQVTPVTRGYRLAAFFWIESMVRDDTQRALLHDLDMSILDLRSAHGDDATSVALTGTYHNLLRMWADT